MPNLQNIATASAFHFAWHKSFNVRPFPTPNRLKMLKRREEKKKVLSSFSTWFCSLFLPLCFFTSVSICPLFFSPFPSPLHLLPPPSSASLTCHSPSFVPTGLFSYWTPRPLHSSGSPFSSQGPNYEPALNKNIYISPKKGFSLCFLWTMRAYDFPFPPAPSFCLFLCWVAIHWGSMSLCDWLALGLLGGSNCVSLSLTVVVRGV